MDTFILSMEIENFKEHSESALKNANINLFLYLIYAHHTLYGFMMAIIKLNLTYKKNLQIRQE